MHNNLKLFKKQMLGCKWFCGVFVIGGNGKF